MNREGKKYVLYPRVSTEMQVDGYSLEGQKNSLKRCLSFRQIRTRKADKARKSATFGTT